MTEFSGIYETTNLYFPTIEITVIDLATNKMIHRSLVKNEPKKSYTITTTVTVGKSYYVPPDPFDRNKYLTEKLIGLLK
jgi:hypothetical protein